MIDKDTAPIPVKDGSRIDYSEICNSYDTSLRNASRSFLTLIKALLYF